MSSSLSLSSAAYDPSLANSQQAAATSANLRAATQNSGQASGSATGQAPTAAAQAKAAKTAQDFASFFISQSLQPMFEGLKTDSMFGGGQGEEMFKSMLLDQYGKMVAKKGGFGITDTVMNQMLKLQEVQS